MPNFRKIIQQIRRHLFSGTILSNQQKLPMFIEAEINWRNIILSTRYPRKNACFLILLLILITKETGDRGQNGSCVLTVNRKGLSGGQSDMPLYLGAVYIACSHLKDARCV